MTGHPIGAVLREAARGRFLEPDGSVDVVPPWRPVGRAVDPRFVSWLAGPDGWSDCLDAVLIALGTGKGGPPERANLIDHPRVRHARLVRTDVGVQADDRGLITRAGRSLIGDALGLLPAGEPVVAAVAPGAPDGPRSGSGQVGG